MISCTDGPVEFEVSIGWFFDLPAIERRIDDVPKTKFVKLWD